MAVYCVHTACSNPTVNQSLCVILAIGTIFNLVAVHYNATFPLVHILVRIHTHNIFKITFVIFQRDHLHKSKHLHASYMHNCLDDMHRVVIFSS